MLVKTKLYNDFKINITKIKKYDIAYISNKKRRIYEEKSFLSLILALVLIIPCMFVLSACGDTAGGSGGTGGSGTGGGTGVGPGGLVAVQTVKSNIGNNFEIVIGGLLEKTIIRTEEACYKKTETTETLYYNGVEYSRTNPEGKFRVYEEIDDFNLDNIVWDEVGLATSLLSRPSSIDPLYGWSSSSATYLTRPMTKYSHATIGDFYIDNATGATFKYTSSYGTVMEVISFTQGSADLTDFIGQIELEV